MSSIKNSLKPSIYDFPLLCQELHHIKGNEETWISLIIGGEWGSMFSQTPKQLVQLMFFTQTGDLWDIVEWLKILYLYIMDLDSVICFGIVLLSLELCNCLCNTAVMFHWSNKFLGQILIPIDRDGISVFLSSPIQL